MTGNRLSLPGRSPACNYRFSSWTDNSGIFEPWKWLRNRDTGLLKNSERKRIYQSLYSCVKPISLWNPHETPDGNKHGAVFNFDFSTDGTILVAACQHRSFLMFDPFSGKLITEKTEAHADCVNCVRFLDGRLFATCSDDRTVALWDCRYLKTKIRSLEGHTYWVKNIEYDSKNGLLLTSGFDGKICTWNINNYSSQEEVCNEVYSTVGLMRSKLSPDNSKLIISTSRGYMIIIHDLDLATLATDLQGFKPHMYRLAQRDETSNSELVVKYNSVFHRKRNRVEYISDFQKGFEAEVVASLQVHPHGWCIVSRNTSVNDDSEWTCVHDIQSSEFDTCDNDADNGTTPAAPSTSTNNTVEKTQPHNSTTSNTCERTRPHIPTRVRLDLLQPLVGSLLPNFIQVPAADTSESSETNSANENPVRGNSDDEDDGDDDDDDDDDDDGYHQNLQEALLNFRERSGLVSEEVVESMDDTDSSDSMLSEPRSGNSASSQWRFKNLFKHKVPKLHGNKARLMFYKLEPNVGEGFIKELCFSHDGRLICSPYKDGVRLLAFNEKCEEVCDCVPSEPTNLHVVQSSQCHTSYVLATKFSPIHCMYVSGCLSGKVFFHQPVL